MYVCVHTHTHTHMQAQTLMHTHRRKHAYICAHDVRTRTYASQHKLQIHVNATSYQTFHLKQNQIEQNHIHSFRLDSVHMDACSNIYVCMHRYVHKYLQEYIHTSMHGKYMF
jgi:hypothetical protein